MSRTAITLKLKVSRSLDRQKQKKKQQRERLRKIDWNVYRLIQRPWLIYALKACKWVILYNYPPKGRWIVVDIYPPLFTDPEGDSCFSIYQIRWMKKRFFNFFFWNFRETRRHFSLRSQNSEYPRIFQVTGANQNAGKLLSTDLVNTNNY